MGVFDKLLNAIRINDEDYDDEYYDDEDFGDDDADDEIEEKPRRSFFSRIRSGKSYDDDDYDDYDDASSDEKPKKSYERSSGKAAAKYSGRKSGSKITPLRKRSGNGMEVCVFKPVSMEDTREISDTLLAGCTVILNLEGINIELAQRIIDFSSGTCYAIGGSLQKVSSYIFILTPANVDISGDITDMLSNAVPMHSNI